MPSPDRHAVFPGTFDPLHAGHVDLIRRALAVFDRVTVAVAEHHAKHALLSLDERLELARASVAPLGGDRVRVVTFTGLLVDGCRALGAGAVVRGVRSATDLEYERAMALTNRALDPGLETVLLLPSSDVAHVSSTLVRQIARMGGDVSGFVPGPVAEALRGRFPKADPS